VSCRDRLLGPRGGCVVLLLCHRWEKSGKAERYLGRLGVPSWRVGVESKMATLDGARPGLNTRSGQRWMVCPNLGNACEQYQHQGLPPHSSGCGIMPSHLTIHVSSLTQRQRHTYCTCYHAWLRE
jgi:hypothetical protein